MLLLLFLAQAAQLGQLLDKKENDQGHQEEIDQAAAPLITQLITSPFWAQAQTIATTVSGFGEVPTERLINLARTSGKTVVIPRTMPQRQMVFLPDPGPEHRIISEFGIPEPALDTAAVVDKANIDLIIVPGIAFSQDHGWRLGFGGGYYDRWLSQFSGFTVGLCRNCILQDHVPLEPHDQSVQVLITDQETFFYE